MRIAGCTDDVTSLYTKLILCLKWKFSNFRKSTVGSGIEAESWTRTASFDLHGQVITIVTRLIDATIFRSFQVSMDENRQLRRRVMATNMLRKIPVDVLYRSTMFVIFLLEFWSILATSIYWACHSEYSGIHVIVKRGNFAKSLYRHRLGKTKCLKKIILTHVA